MPYIVKELREELNKDAGLDLVVHYMSTLTLKHFAGALNYAIYKIVKTWVAENGMSYFNLSAILGTIDANKEELRRRILNDYEDEKIKENGDV